MLKLSFLLLILLNSLQISTASDDVCENYEKPTTNLTIEEQKIVNDTKERSEMGQCTWKDYIVFENDDESATERKKMKRMLINIFSMWNKMEDYMSDVKKYGNILKEEVEKFSALDEIPLNSGWVQKSHVELCKKFNDFQLNKVADLSSYNITLLNQYNQFFDAITEFPNFEMDIEKIKEWFQFGANEKLKKQGAEKELEFSRYLRCLQSLKSSSNRELFDKMKDLFITFWYLEEMIVDSYVEWIEKGIVGFIIFVIVAIGIVKYSKAFRRLCRSCLDELIEILDFFFDI